MGIFDDVKKFTDQLRQKTLASPLAKTLQAPVIVNRPVAQVASSFAKATPRNIVKQGVQQQSRVFNTPVQTPKIYDQVQKILTPVRNSPPAQYVLGRGQTIADRAIGSAQATKQAFNKSNSTPQRYLSGIQAILSGTGAVLGATPLGMKTDALLTAPQALLKTASQAVSGKPITFGSNVMNNLTGQESIGSSLNPLTTKLLGQQGGDIASTAIDVASMILGSYKGGKFDPQTSYLKTVQDLPENFKIPRFLKNDVINPNMKANTNFEDLFTPVTDLKKPIDKSKITLIARLFGEAKQNGGSNPADIKDIQSLGRTYLKDKNINKLTPEMIVTELYKHAVGKGVQQFASDIKVPQMRVDRTKLTGKQLDMPSEKFPTRLTPEQLLEADRLQPLRMNSETKARESINEFKTSSLDERPTPVAQRSSELQTELKQVTPKLGKSNQSSPSDDIVSRPLASQEIMDSAKNLKPNQKVNAIDYIRTPDRVLNKIGLGKEATLLKDQYRKYVKELPEEINKITEWYKQVPELDSAVNIFRKLDGQDVPLTPQETKVAGEIKNYLSEWADKLGLPKDKRVANYITHLFEDDLIQKEFDPDLARIIGDKVPGSVYDPFLQERLGAQGYKENVWDALDAYVKRATRKYNMDPALSALKEGSKNVDVESQKYLTRLGARINLRPTEFDNLVDNLVKSTVGYRFGQRPVANISRKIRQAVYRGTLGLNIGSSVRNLTQGANTYAKLGEKYTIKGYVDMFSDLLKNGDELKRSGVLSDNIVQDRSLSSSKKFWENLDKGLFSLFSLAERVNRGSAYFGAKAKALSSGASEQEAIKQAIKLVEDTQFTFGSVDTPVALQSDMGKILTQFQSFNVKQTEFLTEMIKSKDLAGLVRFAGANLLLMTTIGKLFGMEPKDIIPFSGVLTGESKLGQTPPIQALTGLGQVAFGDEEKRQEGFSTLKKTIPAFIPGGVQLKKTYEGINAYREGASLTPTGRTRFEVPKTPTNAVKTAVFGQYSTPEAKTYFKNQGKSKSEIIAKDFNKLKTREEKSKLWQQYIKEGKITDSNKSDVIKALKDVSLKTTDKEKTIRSLPVKDGSRARQIKKQFDKLKTREEKSALWKKYQSQGIITKEVADQLTKLLK